MSSTPRRPLLSESAPQKGEKTNWSIEYRENRTPPKRTAAKAWSLPSARARESLSARSQPRMPLRGIFVLQPEYGNADPELPFFVGQYHPTCLPDVQWRRPGDLRREHIPAGRVMREGSRFRSTNQKERLRLFPRRGGPNSPPLLSVVSERREVAP